MAGTPNKINCMSTKRTGPSFGKPAVEMALDPVIGRAAAVVREDVRIASGFGVQLVTLAHHRDRPNTTGLCGSPGAVRIRMMSAVNRDPFARDGA